MFDKDYFYQQAKGYFYAWVGQNATTGSPNTQTGRMTMFGGYCKFRKRKERDKFVDEFYSHNPGEFAVRCNIQSGRQYCLGWSLEEYYQELSSLDCADDMTWEDQQNRDIDSIFD